MENASAFPLFYALSKIFPSSFAGAFTYRFKKVCGINEMKDNLTFIDFGEIQQVAEKNC